MAQRPPRLLPDPSEGSDRNPARGDRRAAALRHLFNRMLGQISFCLQTGQHYQPHKAFASTAA
jgi:hypothetical protein